MNIAEARAIIREYYLNPNPGEEDKFLFEEAYGVLIETFHNPADMHDLAFHYLEQRSHDLELKYLEMAAEYNFPNSLEELGYIWYYGQTGTVDYKKAYEYFTRAAKCGDDMVTAWARHKIADMYHYGYYVEKDEARYREMLADLYRDMTKPDGAYFRFHLMGMPYADVAMRYAEVRAQEGAADEAAKMLREARAVLSENIRNNPEWWGNLEVMEGIVKLQRELEGEGGRLGLYDVCWLVEKPCRIAFLYNCRRFIIEVVKDDEDEGEGAEGAGEVAGATANVIRFDGKWFQTAREFLEKAAIDRKKLVCLYDELYDMEVAYG